MTTPRFQIENRRIFFEGSALPGPEHNAAFANLLRCPDGSLLLAHRIGTHKNSAAGAQRLWRSRDDGVTWTRVAFPFTQTSAGLPAELRTVAMSDLGSGKIALLLTWIEHPDDAATLVNPKTEGLLPIHIGWSSSLDSGSTWTPLAEIPVAPLVQPAGNGPMIRLPDGGLVVAFETYKHYDDPMPWSSSSAIAISADEGRTWKSKVVAIDPSHGISYYDQHLHALSDGTLLNMMWVDDRRKPGISEIWAMKSGDFGRSWSVPAPTGIEGQFSTALALRDGRLLMLYVVRHGAPAIRMALGSPDGREWEAREDWVFYSHGGDDLARAKGGGYAAYLQNMATWTFGWPSLELLADGSVLAGYYTGEGDRTSVWLARIAVE